VNDRERRIRDFVVSSYPVDPGDLRPDTPLVAPGLIDSMGIVEVVSFLEREFGIRVAGEEVSEEHFASVEKIAAFVDRKLGPRADG
jgi:acyl carrier protein